MATNAEFEALRAQVEALTRQTAERDAAEKRAHELAVQMGREKAPNRFVKELEPQPGAVQCVSEECPEHLVRKPAEFTGTLTEEHARGFNGEVLSTVERSWLHWHLLDPEAAANCESCGEPLNQLHPGASSPFKLRGTEKERWQKLADANLGITTTREAK